MSDQDIKEAENDAIMLDLLLDEYKDFQECDWSPDCDSDEEESFIIRALLEEARKKKDEELQNMYADRDRKAKKVHRSPKKRLRVEGKSPEESVWWIRYLSRSPESFSTHDAKRFRRRFRMTPRMFHDLVGICKEEKWFPKRESKDCTGKQACRLEIMLACALAYGGGGVLTSYMSDLTNVSEESIRSFIVNEFAQVGIKHMVPKWVRMPTSNQELEKLRVPFDLAGLHGIVGSTDATHVHHWNVPFSLKNNSTGRKQTTTVSFNVVVSHMRKVLSCSPVALGTTPILH